MASRFFQSKSWSRPQLHIGWSALCLHLCCSVHTAHLINVPSLALAPLCISLSFYSTVSFTMRPTPMPHKKAMDTYQLWHVVQRKTWDCCGGWGGEWYTSKEVVRGHTVPQFPLSYHWGWAWKLCPCHGQSSVACSSDGLGYLREFIIVETPCLLRTRYLWPPHHPPDSYVEA